MSTLTDTFSDIADAIRAKTGSSATMTPAQMPTEIASIGGGGVELIYLRDKINCIGSVTEV